MYFDTATIRDAVTGPGTDTRSWIQYGLVDASTAGGHSTRFNDQDGTPLQEGVMVDVTLQPSGLSVPCRIAGQTGGSGEGEYSPFGPGDEVIVAIPDGNERNGCVIIGRLSNGKDVFPSTVAGIDVTKNNVTFRRLKTPYIMETASTWMVRSAATGANFNIDPTGNVMIADGLGSMLALNQSVIALQDGTQSSMLQIDTASKTLTLQSSSGNSSATTFQLDDGGGLSSFMSGGSLALVTSGGGYALGHAVTVEQVIAILKAFMLALAPQGILTGTIVAGLAPTILQLIAATLSGAVLTTTDQGTLNALLAGTPDPTGTKPGFGRPGLLF